MSAAETGAWGHSLSCYPTPAKLGQVVHVRGIIQDRPERDGVRADEMPTEQIVLGRGQVFTAFSLEAAKVHADPRPLDRLLHGRHLRVLVLHVERRVDDLAD